MSTPKTEKMRRQTVRVAYVCDDSVRPQSVWALEALLARRGIKDWELVSSSNTEAVDLEIKHDAKQWDFVQDTPPDAKRDPLATTFWWLARVEELLANEEHFDEHGRYKYAGSALEKVGNPFATPVDDLAFQLELPTKRSEDTNRKNDAQNRDWGIVATHDIDLPWRWTRAGKRRAVKAIVMSLRHGRIVAALTTLAALCAYPWWKIKRSDPWCNAEKIRDIELRCAARSTSYVIADARVSYDGPADMHQRGGERYINELVKPLRRRRGRGRYSAGGVVGVHGSYTSSTDIKQLKLERSIVERVAGISATDHRFHYLRHKPVDAWPMLEAAGFHTDASLGYAEQPGFRAGTAHPYRAWDHQEKRALDLIVIPLAFMDASLDERYLDMATKAESAVVIDELVNSVERVNGRVSVLWHNDRLGTFDARKWTRLYINTLNKVRNRGGDVVTAREAALAYRSILR